MWFKHQIRVRYEETDQMGVVYHANYLTWFEIGRTELIRAAGVPYRTFEERGLLLPLIEAEQAFRKPARYDDIVSLYTRVAAATGRMLEFESQVRLETGAGDPAGATGETPGTLLRSEPVDEPAGELLVSGRTRHIWVNAEWKPVRLDKREPELFGLLGKLSGSEGVQ
ncbi:hypothetical protein J31TS4_15270 [Paenibacillus sp. J31TS4]|uniref:acyl-CoA thioesterase n=1 Tax=Paenibacillus sp. J31TS4 TaxID=2807195 RepID=UPI001B01DC4A|nr:thioesterase family protein [Paenibacillus sp. J31TS4]GIP38247.1 hypothetical protein J31TS4_15270 [Paenibacillus sp. J31TS4]